MIEPFAVKPELGEEEIYEKHEFFELTVPMIIEKIKPNATIPEYKTDGSSGMDLFSAGDYVVPAKGRVLVETGLKFEMPHGFEIQIRPRSGLALKHGVTVLNSPGTIDSDYRGEICVILYNTSNEDFHISVGDRIAQAVLATTIRVNIEEGRVGETERGEGGFGSTGK